MKHIVARAADIAPGQRMIVEIDHRSIGVFNLDGEFFALRNLCPHQGAELCEGKLWGSVESSVPGEYAYDDRPGLISCPWHGWEFDIRSGQSWCQPRRMRTAGYEVTITPGTQIVDRDVRTGQQRVKGPFVADTIAVTVEEDYVVLELS
jgi:nitrite reductase/ring-hydroxylating ferredoxin subunit